MSNIVQEGRTLEDDFEYAFCRIAHEKLKEYYNLYIDVLLGGFGLVCPPDTNIYHAWMG